ncbi:MAG: hypothetical protein WCI18_09785 [Pseudomonadota bacterium]
MVLKFLIIWIATNVLISCGPKFNPKAPYPGENPPTRGGYPNPSNPNEDDQNKAGNEKNDDKECRKPSSTPFERLIVENENPKVSLKNVSDLVTQVEKTCGGCHLAPAASVGGFSFVAQLENKTVFSDGQKKEIRGLKNAYKDMIRTMESGAMPPQAKSQNTDYYKKITQELRSWEASGLPSETYNAGTEEGSRTPTSNTLSELGSCIPSPEILGSDKNKDSYFANMEALPKSLKDTDLYTLDSKALAKSGTVSYSVEYPLWADNAEKGRYVHFPETPEGKRSQAILASGSNSFILPANARFYKNFYKAVQTSDGSVRYKIIETRIIVTRDLNRESLFGTYKWNDDESNAILIDAPYRDGTGFKDDIFNIEVNTQTKAKRKYAIPGSERCIECHKVNRDLVLGFTPLQLNRRAVGEGGRDLPVNSDELGQVKRLQDYGFLSSESKAFPKLETDYGTPASNEELVLQGYMVGNCSHCHSPDGFAMKDNQVKLDLSPGKLFQFNINSISKNSNRDKPSYFVRAGDTAKSYMYKRVSQVGVNPGEGSLPMPLHTPGDANCRLLNLTGKWIYRLGNKAPSDFNVDCKPNNDFYWVDRDLTWPKSDSYVPRRSDWKEDSGMPRSYKSLTFDKGLENLAASWVPAGYYETSGKEDLCRFPNKPLPRNPLRWMLDDQGQAKRPFGEAYFTTPGAWAYNSTCSKCHGQDASSKSALASNLLTISGGSIRVPSFKDGLFGAGGDNLEQFEVSKPVVLGQRKISLAPNYLIWMAMEGTKVNFPPEFEPYLGKHKAQMLNQVRERCKGLIATAPQKLSDRMIDYAVFKDICFYKNGNAKTKEIQYDPDTDQPVNEEKQNAWADKAAINVGYAIFKYLKDSLPDRLQETPAACEKRYPK